MTQVAVYTRDGRQQQGEQLHFLSLHLAALQNSEEKPLSAYLLPRVTLALCHLMYLQLVAFLWMIESAELQRQEGGQGGRVAEVHV